MGFKHLDKSIDGHLRLLAVTPRRKYKSRSRMLYRVLDAEISPNNAGRQPLTASGGGPRPDIEVDSRVSLSAGFSPQVYLGFVEPFDGFVNAGKQLNVSIERLCRDHA